MLYVSDEVLKQRLEEKVKGVKTHLSLKVIVQAVESGPTTSATSQKILKKLDSRHVHDESIRFNYVCSAMQVIFK